MTPHVIFLCTHSDDVLDWLHVQQTEDEFGFIAGAISVVSSTHSRRNAQFTMCVNLHTHRSLL